MGSGTYSCSCGYSGSEHDFKIVSKARYCFACSDEANEPRYHNVRRCPQCSVYLEVGYDHLAAGEKHE